MSAIYDNWERLVDAVLKRQQLWQLFHEHSRSPSILSDASDFSSSFNSRVSIDDLDLPRLQSFSTYPRAPKLVLVSDFSHSINFENAQLASSEFLGRGTFGSVYVATIDKRVRIVVKRLEPASVSQKEFNRQMAIVGGVRHANVVSLRAYYSMQNERLMLYDYYRWGSVHSLLHGRNGEPRANVDWESRLKIAIGAGRGLAEIHKHYGGQLVHGNIKSSNVFRNPDQYGCVSDLGPTNLIQTTFKTTAHYHAPEVKNSQNVSQASDVYSFGILLLELLTRKPSVHVPGGVEAVDLVKMVTSMENGIWAADVFDADLLKDPTIKEEMVRTLQIAMKCVEKSVLKRQKMAEVVKMLEEIRFLHPISVHVPEVVFVEDPDPQFDFCDLYMAASEGIGWRGTFGTCIKGILETGNDFFLRVLPDVVPYKDFQQHVDTIGRIRHKNVAKVKAYSYWNNGGNNGGLLVFDQCFHDSLSRVLHWRERNPRKPRLDWEARMKIAVDAARGIAHVHSKDGRRLVHGNIKSSNILLNPQKRGIVSDVGLARLVSPIRISAFATRASCAPELGDTRDVSQSSDVYSFGVVLLELVTGKPSQITIEKSKTVSLVDWIRSTVCKEWSAEVFDLQLLGAKTDGEAMAQTLRIAMDCVRPDPERRPRMQEVVKMLEEVSGIEPLHESGSEELWEQRSMESRLGVVVEDLLIALTL